MPNVEAVYGLSGTLSPGEPKWDICETIKSIASKKRRAQWLDNKGEAGKYTDEALQNLYHSWDLDDDVTSKQDLLIPILLLRNEGTIIDGQPAMKNYRAMLVPMDEADIQFESLVTSGELLTRESMIEGIKEGTPTVRMVMARWLAWSSWLLTYNWIDHGRDSKTWWDKFTLSDAKEYARGQKLVSVLQNIKRRGGKPVIFAEYIFLLQFAAKVRLFILRNNVR